MAGDSKRLRSAEAESAFLRVIMSQELDEKGNEHTPQHFHHHDCYLSARGRWRRKFLQASSFMGALAAVGPWFGKLARADEVDKPAPAYQGEGRVHVVPSTKETVQLGVYDTNLPPILTIDLSQ